MGQECTITLHILRELNIFVYVEYVCRVQEIIKEIYERIND